jgi:pimeloyl-ACP methyl ester carboxylesterase
MDKSLGASLSAIVLIHGMFKNELSMQVAAEFFRAQGHPVINAKYDSTHGNFDAHARAVAQQLHLHRDVLAEVPAVHLVTHSAGGIVARHLYEKRPAELRKPGGIVMLGTPNHGSRLIDMFEDASFLQRSLVSHWNAVATFFKRVALVPVNVPQIESLDISMLGPAFFELNTHTHHPSIPPEHPLYVVSGTHGFDSAAPFLSSLMNEQDGPHDGVVTVASSKADEMKLHDEIDLPHTGLPGDQRVLQEVYHFLEHRTPEAA